MSPRGRIDPEELARLLEADTPMRLIADQFGVTVSGVSRAAARHGLRPGNPRRTGRPRQVDREEVARRWTAGEPTAAIAAAVGCTRGMVSIIAAEMGLPPRKPRSVIAYTDAQLLGTLRRLARELGRTPSSYDLRRCAPPWPESYRRRWGSHRRALAAAGAFQRHGGSAWAR